MSYKFKKGDAVVVIDEDVCGVIAFAKAEQIKIISEEGFEYSYHPSELMLDQSFQVKEVIASDTIHATTKKNKSKQTKENVIDLHLHEVINNEQGLTNHEKLTAQLEYAKSEFIKAQDLRTKKLVFIHGVGTGKLKFELHKWLKGKAGINFYDANFKDFGLGATEVVFYKV